MAGGRPTKMTEATLLKLEHGFACGMTDVEASLYADIAPSTLYLYCSENEEFSERKEELKKKPSMTAKLNMVTSIQCGDLDNSKWWLERKNKDEFSTKQSNEITGADGGSIQTENRIVIDFGDGDGTQE